MHELNTGVGEVVLAHHAYSPYFRELGSVLITLHSCTIDKLGILCDVLNVL